MQPIKKELFEKLLAAGVESFILHWSGGDDQGYLSVTINYEDGRSDYNSALYQEIEDWAYNAYCYSGAGDGTPYGDDYTYDIANRRVSHSEWSMVRQEIGNYSDKLDIDTDDAV